jgi:hypothetical protein
MAAARGRIVEPRVEWDYDAERSAVLCSCGGQMNMEQGKAVDGRDGAYEWAWWRCSEDPGHVTRAIPLPVHMARG